MTLDSQDKKERDSEVQYLDALIAEGLQIETQYGKMVESIEDETLILNGNETQVLIFRLGRVAMLYMSLDGTQIGHWNDEAKEWEPLLTPMPNPPPESVG